MKIVLAVGARPNFMKIAPILRALKKYPRINFVLVHTGQHYDHNMSGAFFQELGIPKPKVHLGVGSGSHAFQTAEVMKRFEKVLLKEKPDYVVVVGDVNSTLACALTASKLHIKIAHVESGLRSFDRRMPEEINRIVTDSLSDILFTTQEDAGKNLIKEGIPARRIFQAGDVMVDNLYYELKKSKDKKPKIHHPYGVLTLHRSANVDDKRTLEGILRAVNRIAEEIPIYFSLHPRTKKQLKRFHITLNSGIRLLEPLGYREFLRLYRYAAFVLTDSGGVQLETSVLNVPCLTLRESTERVNTITKGTNILTGLNPLKIVREAKKIISGKRKQSHLKKMWDGKAAERIVRILWKSYKSKSV